MNIYLKTVLIGCLSITGIAIVQFELWRALEGILLPSSFFQALDNIELNDGEVSYPEWYKMYAVCTTNRNPQAECFKQVSIWIAEFHCIDRDSDRVLSWAEYRKLRFLGESDCPARSNISKMPISDFESGLVQTEQIK